MDNPVEWIRIDKVDHARKKRNGSNLRNNFERYTYEINLNGVYVCTKKSIKEVADVVGVCHSTVTDIIRNEKKTRAGYTVTRRKADVDE